MKKYIKITQTQTKIHLFHHDCRQIHHGNLLENLQIHHEIHLWHLLGHLLEMLHEIHL
jgi:hypothetical protein